MVDRSMEEAYEDAEKPICDVRSALFHISKPNELGGMLTDKALGTQVNGSHYLGFPIQPIEFINANEMDFLQGSIIKYISRHKLKGGRADVEKAIHFCKLILELQYREE